MSPVYILSGTNFKPPNRCIKNTFFYRNASCFKIKYLTDSLIKPFHVTRHKQVLDTLMENRKNKLDEQDEFQIYEDLADWHVNTGDKTIHAKRVPGTFRSLKWYLSTLWLIYFLTPYLRWDGQQAILLDIPNRQFHLFSITIHPQDVWMLSLLLILSAIILFGVAAIVGRAFCGYFCFQTIWTDVFTWIEEKIEGNPAQRRKLDKAPLNGNKIGKKLLKHSLWLIISAITGITFAAYFTDAYQLWVDYFTLQAGITAWVVLLLFILGTYFLAGFLREQTCLWLCPYARIQGVMYDKQTILPTYDAVRGEPRGKLKDQNRGSCIDCRLCVAVCPTGVDIRAGQQEGCITCGLCIDACDSIMDKIDAPRGLVRYASLDEMNGRKPKPIFKRARVIIYLSIIIATLLGVLYGLLNIAPVDWHVLHQRQPLYTLMSDGSVQNKFTFKILNKTGEDMRASIRTEGLEGVTTSGLGETITLRADKLIPFDAYVRSKPNMLPEEQTPITFVLKTQTEPVMEFRYKSVMIRPPRQN